MTLVICIDEIEKAPEQDEEAPETPKVKSFPFNCSHFSPPSLSPQAKRDDLPPVRKIKSESLDNEVLRAFGRAVTTMYRVATGKEALDMLLRSGLTKQVECWLLSNGSQWNVTIFLSSSI